MTRSVVVVGGGESFHFGLSLVALVKQTSRVLVCLVSNCKLESPAFALACKQTLLLAFNKSWVTFV